MTSGGTNMKQESTAPPEAQRRPPALDAEKNPSMSGKPVPLGEDIELNSLENVATNDFGARPACFKNTLQECLFVFAAAMGVGLGSFVSGATAVISTFIGRDLNMTTVEITWIAASSG